MRARLVTALVLSVLFTGCAGTDTAAPPRPQLGLVPYAGPFEVPELPAPAGLRGRDRDASPAGGELERDGGIGDAFGAEGQVATYAFQADAGELSVFELHAVGFSRGWQATAGLRVLDGAGRALVEHERAGGASFVTLLAFEATSDGRYQLELRAVSQHYRYSLLRHSSFLTNAPGTRQVIEGDRAAGYLADSDDRARFAVELADGESARVELRHLRERAEKGSNRNRRTALAQALERDGATTAPNVERLLAQQRAATIAAGETPEDPHIAIERKDGSRAPEFVLPPGTARVVELDVVARDTSDGGLFTLDVIREPEEVSIAVRIGDRDDDPIEGAKAWFLREPRLDALAAVTTDAAGMADIHVPPGDYAVLFNAGDAPLLRVEVRLTEPGELNLIFE